MAENNPANKNDNVNLRIFIAMIIGGVAVWLMHQPWMWPRQPEKADPTPEQKAKADPVAKTERPKPTIELVKDDQLTKPVVPLVEAHPEPGSGLLWGGWQGFPRPPGTLPPRKAEPGSLGFWADLRVWAQTAHFIWTFWKAQIQRARELEEIERLLQELKKK